MESKFKILIGVLLFTLIVVVSCLCINKPKKYVKQQYRKQPEDKQTICPNVTVVNNNDAMAEAINNLSEKLDEQKQSQVVEEITAEECAERLYNAMLGHGTDSRALLQVFDYIDSDDEFDAVMDAFAESYGEFDKVLANEMFSGAHVANKINDILLERGIDRMITID